MCMCQLRIKSEPFLVDLKFKSELQSGIIRISKINSIPVNFIKHVASKIQFNEFFDRSCGASKQEEFPDTSYCYLLPVL